MAGGSEPERLVRVEERQDQIFAVLESMESELALVTGFVRTHLAWEAAIRSVFTGTTKVVAVLGVLFGIWWALVGG